MVKFHSKDTRKDGSTYANTTHKQNQGQKLHHHLDAEKAFDKIQCLLMIVSEETSKRRNVPKHNKVCT
jgi:hypothetical protein